MKKYKILYQKGNDRLETIIEAEDSSNIQYEFYMSNPNCDIISITEVTNEEDN